MSSCSISAAQIASVFNAAFADTERTVLVGGASEPLYTPGDRHDPARIHFRADYPRSALHEVAHWCLAGRVRRQLADYGYWYSPDGRDLERQRAFFTVEARPQAIERCFCEMVSLPFAPSIDNLGLEIPAELQQAFTVDLDRHYHGYQQRGLPPRAARFADALKSLKPAIAA